MKSSASELGLRLSLKKIEEKSLEFSLVNVITSARGNVTLFFAVLKIYFFGTEKTGCSVKASEV